VNLPLQPRLLLNLSPEPNANSSSGSNSDSDPCSDPYSDIHFDLCSAPYSGSGSGSGSSSSSSSGSDFDYIIAVAIEEASSNCKRRAIIGPPTHKLRSQGKKIKKNNRIVILIIYSL
jgi:hypothetical protein